MTGPEICVMCSDSFANRGAPNAPDVGASVCNRGLWAGGLYIGQLTETLRILEGAGF